jgi:hypothetical protein
MLFVDGTIPDRLAAFALSPMCLCFHTIIMPSVAPMIEEIDTVQIDTVQIDVPQPKLT